MARIRSILSTVTNYFKILVINMVLFYLAGLAVGSAAIYANLPTRYTLGHVIPSVSYLASGKLQPIENGKAVETGEIKVTSNVVI